MPQTTKKVPAAPPASGSAPPESLLFHGHMEALFSRSLEGMILASPSGEIFAANGEACRIFERTEVELKALGCAAILSSIEPSTVRVIRHNSESGAFLGEVSGYKPDGRAFPISLSYSPFQDAEGNTRLTLLIRDITDFKDFLQVLEESEQKYRLLVENVNDGIVISQDERFVYFNARFAELLGYEPDELRLKSYQDIYTEEGLRILMARHARRERGENPPARYETVFRRKDGRDALVEANVTIIHYKERLATFAVIRDISERKRAEKEREVFGRLGIELASAESIESVGRIVRSCTTDLFQWDALYFSFRLSGRMRFRSILRIDTIDGRTVSLPPSEWDLGPESFLYNLEKGKPLLINRDQMPPPIKLVSFGDRTRLSASLIFAPMHRQSTFLGVLSVQSYTPGCYSEQDAELLQRLADMVRPTLERFLAERQSQAFAALAYRLSASISPESAARIILDVADQIVGWDSAYLDLYDAARDRMESLLNVDTIDGVKRDVPPAYTQCPSTHVQRHVARNGATLLLRGQDDEQLAALGLTGFGNATRLSQSIIKVPVRNSTGVIGFLSIQSYTTNAYDRADLKIVESLASYCSATLERTRAERQMRKSEMRYRSVVETVETAIVGITIERKVFEWNRHAERLFGYGREEVMGLDFFALLLPVEIWDTAEADIQAVFAGEAPPAFESRVRTRDGRDLVILWNRTRMLDEDGGVVGVLACGQDVTERKAYERALQQSEAQYRAIVEDQTELICRFQPDGEITFVNEAACLYFHKPRTALLHLHVQDLLGLPRNAATPWRILTPEQPVCTHQHRIICPLEGSRWHEWTYRAILDAEGRIQEYQSTARDITALKSAQEALHKSQEQYERLLDSSTDVIFQVNQHGAVIYTNPACERVFGYKREEFMSDLQLAQDILQPESRHKFVYLWKEYGKTGKFPEDTGVWAWNHKNGRTVFTENRLSILQGEDGIVGFLAVCRDVTERVRLEQERVHLDAQIQQAQKHESMSVLAGGIAHDFNNLLTGILGNAGLALMDLDPEHSAVEAVTHIQTAALRASELTRQMLAYAGRGKLVVQILNMSLIVREMAALLQAVLSKHASLELELDDALPPIEGDATQIRQVVMNIITNASDALEGSPGSIRIRTGRRSLTASELAQTINGASLGAGDYVFFQVEDTGCGMDEDTRRRMFDPFFTKKPTGMVGGRGLGLAAVLGIVRNHKGAIQVRTAVNAGTTFTIYLPGVQERPLAEPTEGQRRQRPPQLRETGHVLVVDDEEIVRRVARGVLEKAGFDVLQARDGVEGVELFRTHHASGQLRLVLLDLRMPRMDGRRAFQEMKQVNPQVPIVLMSGFAEQEVNEAFENFDPSYFVEKPFNPVDLLAKVRLALTKSGLVTPPPV